jgi:ABC-2 type transport system ATP-binding protein
MKSMSRPPDLQNHDHHASSSASIPVDRPGPIIEAHNLTKRYGDTIAVNGIDLEVGAGEIFGILGPNGAGKTTTLEMLEGLREPDGGTARIAGHDVVEDIVDVRKIIGVQLQSTSLFPFLTSAELIELFASLYETDSSSARVDELLEMVGLEEKRGARVDEMSGGQQQRLSIALGLVNKPLVTFLDEPTTGLDPGARRGLWKTIQNVRDSGMTIVLTTHYMEEAEVLCDRVAVMDYGEIIALDSPQGLIRNLDSAATILAKIENGHLDENALTALDSVTSANVNRDELEIRTAHVQHSLMALLELANREHVTLTDLRSSQATLEDVFLGLTGRTYVQEEENVKSDSEEEPEKPGGLRARFRR